MVVGIANRPEDAMTMTTERLKIGGCGRFPPGHFDPFRLSDDPIVARILYEVRKEAKEMHP